MRKYITAGITFLAGLFFVAEFVLPAKIGRYDNPLTAQLGLAARIVIILTAMALLLGPINLIRAHLTTLVRRRPGGLSSATFLVCFVGGLVIAIAKEGGSASVVRVYNWIFYGLMLAFGATSMALLTFYLISAAYRSFRLKSLDAAVMMVAATIVLLGLTPVGAWLTHALPEAVQLPTLAGWLLAVPNTGVQRAVLIGACAGALAAGMRHWLGLGARAE